MNHGGGEPSLASLIERSAELKRALVDFALSPRFERHLEQFILEAADPYQELSEGEAIGVIDRSRFSTACRTARPCWTSSWPAGRI
jgi:hypothetical protein